MPTSRPRRPKTTASKKARALDRDLEAQGVEPVESVEQLAIGTKDDARELLRLTKRFRTKA